MFRAAQCRFLVTIPRNPAFKRITEIDLTKFQSIVGDSGMLTSDLEAYNTDWMKKYVGHSKCVLRPNSTNQVSDILKYCNDNSIAVVPQGGNTGLVGGSVSVFDEVVIQMGRMDAILSFDEISGVVSCEAGVILEKLDTWLTEKGFMTPLDLGAKGSCMIGGNAATNAGGLRLLRYGSLHGTILGMEMVLPDGTILKNMSKLRKDNTGLDLKQLFIGSEGTLGIITGLTILTPRRPNSVNAAMLALPSYEAVLEAFSAAKGELSEILSAFEFFDAASKRSVLQHRTNLRDPLPDSGNSQFFCLLETQGSNADHDLEKLDKYLSMLMESGVVEDGAVAQGDGQIKEMWAVREGIPEASMKDGAVYKYDISLPLPDLYSLVTIVEERLTNLGLYKRDDVDSLVTSVQGYGHVGDGNIHLNVSATRYDESITYAIEPFVYEYASSLNGSISAEHGLGLMKAPYIKYSKSPEMVNCMRQIKNLLDPKGIMNPYKFITQENK